MPLPWPNRGPAYYAFPHPQPLVTLCMVLWIYSDSSYSIAHAHSAGPGVLGGGPLAKVPSASKRDQHGGNIASKWLQNGSKMVPTWLPNGAWRRLGGVLEPLKRLGRQRGGFKGLTGRSWTPLGPLSGPKKVLLNSSWPLQEEVQDRFQPSWGPKGSRKGGQEGPNRAQEATRAQNTISSKIIVFLKDFNDFEVPGSLFGGQHRLNMASDSCLAA